MTIFTTPDEVEANTIGEIRWMLVQRKRPRWVRLHMWPVAHPAKPKPRGRPRSTNAPRPDPGPPPAIAPPGGVAGAGVVGGVGGEHWSILIPNRQFLAMIDDVPAASRVAGIWYDVRTGVLHVLGYGAPQT